MADKLAADLTAAFSGLSIAALNATEAFAGLSPELVALAEAALERHEDECLGLSLPELEPPEPRTRRIDLE